MLKRKLRRSSRTHGESKLFNASKNPIVEKFIRFCASDFGRKVMGREAEYLRKELAGRKKILEIGCGIGAFAERLSDLNVTGIDKSEAMLREARKKSNKQFVRGSAYNLPFADASFDAVFFVTTLEFLDDYKKAIEETARVLEKDGKLIVMILNPESEYFKAHYERPEDYFRKIKHTNIREIEAFVSRFFETEAEYFMGIKVEGIFDTSDKKLAALYALRGIKR